MLKTALYVRLEAKPGKEDEVEAFLKAGLPIVMEEPATVN
jgi:quinol monooxygenase YgiN